MKVYLTLSGRVLHHSTPAQFTSRSQNYCYQNAMMAMLMYTPSFLSWVQGWHIDREWPKLKYKDHILNALDDVGRAYHAKGTKPARNTQANAAFNVLWQMFRGMKKS